MIFGGVFERHPGLKFVVTEQGVEWVPDLLEGLDGSYTGPQGGRTPNYVQHLKRKERPSRRALLPSEI